MRRFAGLLACFVIAIAQPAATRADSVVRIGGKWLQCPAGWPVDIRANPALPDIGRAYMSGGTGVIEMNTTLLAGMSPIVQLYWFGHECAHHVKRHVRAFDMGHEAEADCYAISMLLHNDWIQESQLSQLRDVLTQSPGSMWGHLRGPERWANVQNCYNQHKARLDSIRQSASKVTERPVRISLREFLAEAVHGAASRFEGLKLRKVGPSWHAKIAPNNAETSVCNIREPAPGSSAVYTINCNVMDADRQGKKLWENAVAEARALFPGWYSYGDDRTGISLAEPLPGRNWGDLLTGESRSITIEWWTISPDRPYIRIEVAAKAQ